MKNPVLFIIFNRPKQTQIVFDVIRRAKPPKLYIASDGPRKNYMSDKDLCIQTRKIVEVIDWPCKVFYLYRAENLGCRKAVSTAITWFFKKEMQGIVLEDDILPSLDFFKFCDVMLEKYKKNHKVGMISGFNPLSHLKLSNSSYLLSSHISIWGWAGWRRTWNGYYDQFTEKDFTDLKSILKGTFSSNLMYYLYWKKLMRLINEGKVDTWDYQLNLMFFKKNYLTAIPAQTLTQNIGFETNDSTNNSGVKPSYIKEKLSKKSIFPLKHEKNIYSNITYDREFIETVHNIKFIPLGLLNVYLKDLRVISRVYGFIKRRFLSKI